MPLFSLFIHPPLLILILSGYVCFPTSSEKLHSTPLNSQHNHHKTPDLCFSSKRIITFSTPLCMRWPASVLRFISWVSCPGTLPGSGGRLLKIIFCPCCGCTTKEAIIEEGPGSRPYCSAVFLLKALYGSTAKNTRPVLAPNLHLFLLNKTSWRLKKQYWPAAVSGEWKN